MRLWVGLVTILIGAGAGAEPFIQVRSETELNLQETVTLGDITEFSGFREEDIRELRTVILGNAPARGEARSWTDVGLSQVFRNHLRRLERLKDQNITLRIPSTVTVTRKSPRLKAAEVEKALLLEFAKMCEVCEFKIMGLRLPATRISTGDGMKWAVQPRGSLPRGSFSVPLSVTDSEGKSRMYWVGGTLEVFRRVPVIKRALAHGERIHPEDISYEQRNVTFENDVPADEKELQAAWSGRSMAAQQIVWRSLIRRESAAKPGETVKVYAGAEAWQISIDGIAQQGGSIGDTIRVRVPRTQKILSGILVDKGRVEVR